MIPQFAKLLKHDERIRRGVYKMSGFAVLGTTLGVTALAMLAMWTLSLGLKDASVVDVFWGLGFVLIAVTCFGISDGYQPRRLIVLTFICIWGVRLATFIFLRNRGKGEDFRYQAMRRRHGKRFAAVSLYTVFGLQGALMWIISLPIQVALCADAVKKLTVFDALALTLWITGFFFEAVGDFQLARFRKDPGNRGKVMDRGLWRYTRHPNYFGDALVWWGFFLIAVPAGRGGIVTVFSPVLMTELLRNVSGVSLLEKTLLKSKPDYEEYCRRTSPFFPWFPRRQEK